MNLLLGVSPLTLSIDFRSGLGIDTPVLQYSTFVVVINAVSVSSAVILIYCI